MDDHKWRAPDDFHALYDRGFRTARAARGFRETHDTEAEARMSAEVPELQIDHDVATQLPVRVSSRHPGAALSRSTASSPESAVTQFVRDHGDIWSLADDDVATVEVRSVSRQGLRTVRALQRVEGVEVFGSNVTVALNPDNDVVSVAGQFFPGAAASRSRAAAPPTTSLEDAVAQAAFDLTGLTYTGSDFSTSGEPSDDAGYHFVHFQPASDDRRPAFERPVRAKGVMFPLGKDEFVPAYYMELWIAGIPAFGYVLDAVGTPDVLFRKNLTSDVAFAYRVHNTGDSILRPEDGPAPGSPHPTGTPDGYQAPTIAERLVTVESLLPGDPWLPATATTTRGNNCIAYADIQPPQGQNAGDVIGQITAPQTFDYTYDHAQGADNAQNVQNSVVGMFFHVNWLHDRWYEAGFDEAAGNAQQDNFGRGGLGGDPILAEGNDFSGTDNANMSTPADGASPRMQMFVFMGPTPNQPSRTSNHEALITFHEMGHYVTNRLIGNASGLTNQQGRAMGEGWGDFFCICMTSLATDDFANGAFPIGGWTDWLPTFDDNYYFSIRRYPYSADMGKNPLTFRHISAGVVLPMGPPRNPVFGTGPNNVVHQAGEVWCSALWDVFVNLVAKHGHAEAERRMLLFVVGGLEITPNVPTYTQARDGIIAAATAMYPADLPEVWAGFAKRGMGVYAVSPPSDSTSLAGVVESFESPAPPAPGPALAGVYDLLLSDSKSIVPVGSLILD